ncbi:MAG: 3-phosphoshikimate 1-carboxyvinyltransferase [Gammaproteobacteria bacterium]|nr:3-phosphoshikimate 1-carboxyvinyltransferase [Gammaproteobacteria bacterium]
MTDLNLSVTSFTHKLFPSESYQKNNRLINIIAPPSKSQTMRSILLASLAENTANNISYINNYLVSPDTDAMISACCALGAEIIINPESTVLTIKGVRGCPELPDNIIDVGNSGQVLRFVGAIAGLIDGYTVFTGDHSIRYNRPLQPLLSGLEALGAQCITVKNDGHAPVIIKGPISSGKIVIDGADSQPVSGLILVSIFLPGQTEITVINPGEKPWIDLTLYWLDKFKIKYSNQNYQKYIIYNLDNNNYNLISSFNYNVPGDFSSILYIVAAAIITQTSVSISNLDFSDPQGDKTVLEILIAMGADLDINPELNTLIINDNFNKSNKSNKSIAKLDGKIIDVNNFIDAVPILAVLACYASSETRLINAKIARSKESDRLSVITQELNKMGAKITELPDGLIIQPSDLYHAIIDSHNDHRIAMSIAVAALGAKNKNPGDRTTIINTRCIDKSYSNFKNDINLFSLEERGDPSVSGTMPPLIL